MATNADPPIPDAVERSTEPEETATLTAPEDEAAAKEILSQPRYNRTFKLPKTASHDELTFSYLDMGKTPATDDESAHVPTILFMPGMFSTRFAYLTAYRVAEKYGVRVICPDRPGIGKSTDVPMELRIPVWLELVPKLLEHLHIEHVSLVSHSAGTMYLLNTLATHRDILDPRRPFVALYAPWVDPEFSKMTLFQLVKYIPTPAFSIWNKIPEFAIFGVQPALAASGSAFSRMADLLPGSLRSQPPSEKPMQENTRRLIEDYGYTKSSFNALMCEVGKQVFAESTVGANGEAMQCARKGSPGLWRACDNYERYVQFLVESERQRKASADAGSPPKLRVRIYYGETDMMIGEEGPKYMDSCWRGKEEGEFNDVIDFSSRHLVGSDHDTVIDMVEAQEEIFTLAGGTA